MHEFAPVRSVAHLLVGLPAAEVERDLILATLEQVDGNRTLAASILGLSVRTIRNKLNTYATDGHFTGDLEDSEA